MNLISQIIKHYYSIKLHLCDSIKLHLITSKIKLQLVKQKSLNLIFTFNKSLHLIQGFFVWIAFSESVVIWGNLSRWKSVHSKINPFNSSKVLLHNPGLPGSSSNPSNVDRFHPKITWRNQISSWQGGTVFHLYLFRFVYMFFQLSFVSMC